VTILKVRNFSYESGGGKYGGILASATSQPQKGVVLFHGHSGKIDKSGQRLGAETYLKRLVGELAAAQPRWAVAGISTHGYGRSWAPDQQMDWVGAKTQQAACDGVLAFADRFGLRDRQLFLWGQSEGGQIAMLLAAKYLRNVAGVISYNGVLDHSKFVATNIDSHKIIESHEALGILPVDYAGRSPINFAGQIRCPVLVWFSHEDVRVRPDIPLSFARVLRRTNKKALALSFEGGHGPIEEDKDGRRIGCGYKYTGDWMWHDYFMPFIRKPDPATFEQALAIYDPIKEKAAAPRQLASWLGSPSPVSRRAAREALAFMARQGTLSPNQLKGFEVETIDELCGRSDLSARELEQMILRTLEGKLRVREGRIINPRGELQLLFNLGLQPGMARSLEELSMSLSASGAKQLLDSTKLGRFFSRSTRQILSCQLALAED
jgi:pimeloyl-ACP methyl ester carboxylesterase